MAAFFIPGDALLSVGTYGGSAPETGYYSAVVGLIESHPTRPTSYKMQLTFDGFTTNEFINSPYDKDGNLLPGLGKQQIGGQVKGVKTILVSAGYTDDDWRQPGGGAHDGWLTGRTVYVEWHSAKDLGGRYGKVVGYVTEVRFNEYKSANKVPAIAAQSEVAGSSGPAPSAPSNGAELPQTIAPAPGPSLPPPPGAQSIVR